MIRLMLVLLFGCGKGDDGSSSMNGSITLPDHSESADISWNKAFYVESGNAMLAFITGIDGASCADIGDFWRPMMEPSKRTGSTTAAAVS